MLGPSDDDDRICVNATAICTSENEVARVAEVLARAVTGLALEGININMGFVRVPADEPIGPFGPINGA